jgi:hypothetical protein
VIRVQWRHDGVQRVACFEGGEQLRLIDCPQAPGLGDVVAAGTKVVGVKPCGPCKARQAAMNKATPGWVSRLLAKVFSRP